MKYLSMIDFHLRVHTILWQATLSDSAKGKSNNLVL